MSPTNQARIPLAFVPPGRQMLLAEFGAGLDPLQREQLAAYGLTENRPLLVLEQQPMTIVQAEHVEIAIEHTVARNIWVESE